MTAIEFVKYARAHQFTAVQVQRQFPNLPLHICDDILSGIAKIDHINPDGTIVIDDDKDDGKYHCGDLDGDGYVSPIHTYNEEY